MILEPLGGSQITAFSSRVAPSLEIAAPNERWAGWNVNKEVIDERNNRRNGGAALDKPHARLHSLFIRPRPHISHATEGSPGISGGQANLCAAIDRRGTRINILRADNRSRDLINAHLRSTIPTGVLLFNKDAGLRAPTKWSKFPT